MIFVKLKLILILIWLNWILALSPWDTIGSHGVRNFMLCKKPQTEKIEDAGRLDTAITRRGNGRWKTWLNKSLNLKISSH